MNRNTFHIWPQQAAGRNDKTVISAVYEMPGEKRQTLWYAIPETLHPFVCTNADPFVVALIYPIMATGVPVHVHEDVSPSLLRNLDEYQMAWAEWLPQLTHTTIRADRELEPQVPTHRQEAVVAFSGGVDCCFTAYRHRRAKGPFIPYNISAGMMVHGFDIPLSEPQLFAAAVARSEHMLNSLNMETIPIATNYRSLVEDWSHAFGSAIASCLMLLSGRFASGLIAQGLTYKEIFHLQEGSNPITDPLLSSDTFKVIPDGTAFTRAQKIYAMRNWQEFLRHTRVCWQGPEKDRNCCRCEKCMRNILTFKALGLGLPPCFPQDVTLHIVSTRRLGIGFLPDMRYGELAQIAREHGVTDPYIAIIAKRLAKLRRNRNHPFLYRLLRIAYFPVRLLNRLFRYIGFLFFLLVACISCATIQR